MFLFFLGRVALVAQQPIVVKLSRGRSVGLSVRTCSRVGPICGIAIYLLIWLAVSLLPEQQRVSQSVSQSVESVVR